MRHCQKVAKGAQMVKFFESCWFIHYNVKFNLWTTMYIYQNK